MELQLSTDQTVFRDTSARFIEATVPLTGVRELADTSDGFDRGWWQEAAELGWTSMLAPEELGGGSISGEVLRDLALVAYQRGRWVSPGPFVPANAAVAALAAMDTRTAEIDDLIAGIMSGSTIAAVAIDELRRTWGSGPFTTSIRASGGDVIVDGIKAPVEAAGQADVFVVAATSPDGPVLVVIPAEVEGVGVRERGGVDLVRRYGSVELAGVRVPAEAVVARGRSSIDRVLDISCVLQMAETVGALDRVFELTLEWMFDRYTFGRPLASYQELKHRVADMRLWLEASKATTIAALAARSADASDASELVSTAKSYIGEHGPELVQDCVQMHGGIGVTWDHDLHLFLRRVTTNAATHGTPREHRERLASMILEGAT